MLHSALAQLPRIIFAPDGWSGPVCTLSEIAESHAEKRVVYTVRMTDVMLSRYFRKKIRLFDREKKKEGDKLEKIEFRRGECART